MTWIREKFKEIKEERKKIRSMLLLFEYRRKRDGTFALDGTRDFAVYDLYSLRYKTAHREYITGSSVRCLTTQGQHLDKAELTLIRFRRQMKRKGWYDEERTHESYSEILRKKQEAFAAKQAGIYIYSGPVSIPD